MMNASFPDLRGEHRTEAVPPVPDRLVADIDATFEQEIFDLPQRQRIADVHHHREVNHLGRTVEITEWIFHPQGLRAKPAGLNPICSDTAPKRSLVRGTGLKQTVTPSYRTLCPYVCFWLKADIRLTLDSGFIGPTDNIHYRTRFPLGERLQ